MRKMTFDKFVILASLIFTATSQPLNSDQFEQDRYLDPRRTFRMLWNFNESHILIQLRVETNGWIGIGFSFNGAMTNADIHVGWVKDGIAHITDRHGPNYQNGFPSLDSEQNLEILEGSECNGLTTITFVRQLAACQPGQDRAITNSTSRVIFAFGSDDPEGDLTWANYHGTQDRGARSLLLLQPQSDENASLNGSDVFTYYARSDGELVPHKRTYYKCLLLEMPSLEDKHHIIKSEPVINENYHANVHHMIVSACDRNDLGEYLGRSVECYTQDLSDIMNSCDTIIAAWAVGAEAFTYPDHIGLSIGAGTSSRFIKLEMHYDNPELIDIRDDSGIKFHYTANLRHYDASVMAVGHLSSAFFLIIPPNVDEFEIHGSCSSSCLEAAMELAGVDRINLINVYPHAHNAGRKMKFRHFRNGTELPVILNDEAYDFDYQQSHLLTPEVTVMKGDELLSVCTYTSLGVNQPIVGGLDTDKEMCISYFFYYPKIPLRNCNSGPSNAIQTILNKMVGISSFRPLNRNKPLARFDLNDLIVMLPEEKINQTVADIISLHEWSNRSISQLQNEFQRSAKFQICRGPQPIIPLTSVQSPIRIENEFVEQNTLQCRSPSSGFKTFVAASACPING